MKKENRLVVASAGWAETLPEWLLEEVKAKRLTLGIAGVAKPTGRVGDAEACAYLYTLGLQQPTGHELAEVYIYLTAKLMKRRGRELPDFAQQKIESGLTPDEQRELDHLKAELYRKRGGDVRHPMIDALKSLKKRNTRRGGNAPLPFSFKSSVDQLTGGGLCA